ncbi:MAG: aminotransferase class I/II-fold pyridoxal phosphate-dependent enzyme [Longimicrobiales bacterium]|nr:aminotransferase class I/II-fold pyridoxal phosphate-dependent enzyme [Longimicrobiales bacterium]
MAGIAERRRALEARGVDVIDLGAGDADLAPPPAAVAALTASLADPDTSRYPFQLGLPALREALAAWMASRFGVTLDPWSDLLPLIGSKEGLAHLPLAVIDPGDLAIVPDPGYQAYFGGVTFAGGTVWPVPLRPENDFLIVWDDLPSDVVRRTRLVYLNYPNNPTAAIAPDGWLQESVDFCREHGIVLAYDHAYSEIAFDGYRPRSILEFDGADEVALEFHSFSKTYNMTGWRLGWVAGRAELVARLSRVKTFLDTGVFKGVQAAGVAALASHGSWLPENLAVFRERRDAAVRALTDAGFEIEAPSATMYLWVPVPGGGSSIEFAERALEGEGVIVIPGAGLGAGGEGYFRVALTLPTSRIEEAARRLARQVG